MFFFFIFFFPSLVFNRNSFHPICSYHFGFNCVIFLGGPTLANCSSLRTTSTGTEGIIIFECHRFHKFSNFTPQKIYFHFLSPILWLSPLAPYCGAAEATSLGFVCFVVINPHVLSANRVDCRLFCFINSPYPRYYLFFISRYHNLHQPRSHHKSYIRHRPGHASCTDTEPHTNRRDCPRQGREPYKPQGAPSSSSN